MNTAHKAFPIQRKLGCSLYISALIASGISPVTPAAAASIVVDDASPESSWGQNVLGKDVIVRPGSSVHANASKADSIASLSLVQGTLYVGDGEIGLSNLKVEGEIVLGQEATLHVGTRVPAELPQGDCLGGSLSTDSLRVDGAGAAVYVTNGQTLQSSTVAPPPHSAKSPDSEPASIHLHQGSLSLQNGTVIAHSLRIDNAGALRATGSLHGSEDNVVDASVRLEQGEIAVEKGTGMTVGTPGSAGGSTDYAAFAQTTDNSGVLLIQDRDLQAKGGRIKAHLVQRGPASAVFSQGQTVVDNLSVASGSLRIENQGALAVLASAPSVDGVDGPDGPDGVVATLDMGGGALHLAEGAGTLFVRSGGSLLASAGVNTVNGSVSLDNSSLAVENAHSQGAAVTLRVQGDLSLHNAGSVRVAANAALAVDGSLKTEQGTTMAVASGGTLALRQEDILSYQGSSVGGIMGGSAAPGEYRLQAALTVQGTLLLTSGAGRDFHYEKSYVDGIHATIVAGQGDVNQGTVGLLYGTLYSGGQAALVDISQPTPMPPTPNNALIMTQGEAFSGNATGQSLHMSEAHTLLLSGALTLTGTDGGLLLTDAQGALADSVVSSGGLLTMGQATPLYAQSGQLGRVTLESGGALEVLNGDFGLTSLHLAQGTAKVEGANFRAQEVTLTSGRLEVLNAHATLENVTATGGTLFVDPAYVDIRHLSGSPWGSELLAGQGAVISVVAGKWLQREINTLQQRGHSFESVLGLGQALTLGRTGKIILDKEVDRQGVITSPSGLGDGVGAHFGADSLLVLAGQAAQGPEGAIQLAGATANNVTIHEKAHLRIVDAKAGIRYTILSGAGSINGGLGLGNGWDADNLSSNTDMLYTEAGSTSIHETGTGSSVSTVFKVRNAEDVYGDLHPGLSALINTLYRQGQNDLGSAHRGVLFLSRATDSSIVPRQDSARLIEGAARLGTVAGVQGMTLTAAKAGSQAVAARSQAFVSPLRGNEQPQAVALHQDGSWVAESGLSAGNRPDNADGADNADRAEKAKQSRGLGLWIMPLYQSTSKWGLDAGHFSSGYTGDVGGLALGGDYAVSPDLRVGLALNMGSGQAQSRGDFHKSTNKVNFGGFTLYSSWIQDNLALSAELGYTISHNDLRQALPQSLHMGSLKAQVETTALSAALRGEYRIQSEYLDIIPSLGLRYTGLNTAAFDTKSEGSVFTNEGSFQNIWTFPLGVTLSKSLTHSSGWEFSPQMDLQIIPAAGDLQAKNRVSVPTLAGSAELQSRIVDDLVYGGGIGLKAQKDHISLGLHYTLQAGEHGQDQGIYGTFHYAF